MFLSLEKKKMKFEGFCAGQEGETGSSEIARSEAC